MFTMLELPISSDSTYITVAEIASFRTESEFGNSTQPICCASSGVSVFDRSSSSESDSSSNSVIPSFIRISSIRSVWLVSENGSR